MSTEIESRLCTNSSIDRCPLPGLVGLIDALTASRGFEPQFDGFGVTVQGRMSPVASSRERMTAEQLLATLRDWDSPDFGLGTRTLLRVPSVDIGRSGTRTGHRDVVAELRWPARGYGPTDLAPLRGLKELGSIVIEYGALADLLKRRDLRERFFAVGVRESGWWIEGRLGLG